MSGLFLNLLPFLSWQMNLSKESLKVLLHGFRQTWEVSTEHLCFISPWVVRNKNAVVIQVQQNSSLHTHYLMELLKKIKAVLSIDKHNFPPYCFVFPASLLKIMSQIYSLCLVIQMKSKIACYYFQPETETQLVNSIIFGKNILHILINKCIN